MKKKMAVKNIIFDLGGVVITLNKPEAIRRFKNLGLTDAEERLDLPRAVLVISPDD